MSSITFLITVDLLLIDCAFSKAKHRLRLARLIDDVLSCRHVSAGAASSSAAASAADCPADKEPRRAVCTMMRPLRMTTCSPAQRRRLSSSRRLYS